MVDFDELAAALSMTDIIRLQDVLSHSLVRRFERQLGLAFSDVVGSTPYFAKFGDEAGRRLQQRHVDLVQKAIAPRGGRVVDTAGDGAFLCFPGCNEATSAMIELQRRIGEDNAVRKPDERLSVRIGCHWGPVLTDGVQVSGDSVNFCARVAGSAGSGEIRLSQSAVLALTEAKWRIRCHRLPPVELKGIAQAAELFSLDWHDHSIYPSGVKVNGGPELPLPAQDLIRFGRLKEQEGMIANDVVLQVADPAQTARISRWHFELHRSPDGFRLRAISEALTEVDGRSLAKGEETLIRAGTQVRVGGVVTLEFVSGQAGPVSDPTTLPK